MGSKDGFLKVDRFDQVKPCLYGMKHRWIHDGILFALPNEKEPEYPYLWRCFYCEFGIRTQETMPKIEFSGNVVEQLRKFLPEINRDIEQGE